MNHRRILKPDGVKVKVKLTDIRKIDEVPANGDLLSAVTLWNNDRVCRHSSHGMYG